MRQTRSSLGLLLLLLVDLLRPGWSLVNKRPEGIIYRPTLDGDKQLASRRIPLTITPDFPMLAEFTENISIATSSSAQLTLRIKTPYASYQLKRIGAVPGSIVQGSTTVAKVDAFESSTLVQEADFELLQRLSTAIVAIPTSFVTNKTFASNTNASATPINPVEQLARIVSEQNDTQPQGPFGRRLLQTSSSSSSQPVTLSEVLAACSNGLTEDFVSTLMSICNQTSPTANNSALSEEAAREELKCLISGACLAKVQCSAPEGILNAVDEPCQQAVASQIRADVAMLVGAEQGRKLAFYQSYLTSVVKVFEGYIRLSGNMSLLVQQQTQSVNASIAVLEERRYLLGNLSSTMIALQEQQDAVTQLLAESIQQSEDIYAQRAQLILDVINQVEALNTVNANVKQILRVAVQATQRSDLIAKLHLVSQTQAAALSANILIGLSKALRDFIHERQIQSQLARQIQAVFLQQESGTGRKFFGSDRGEHPRDLTVAERYQRVFATSFSYVHNATLLDVRRSMLQVFCDIDKLALDDGDGRGVMAYLPDLIGPTATCSFSQMSLLTNLSQPSATYSLDIARWAFAQFANTTSGLHGCKCFAIATETIAVNASLALSYTESNTPQQAAYFHNLTLDHVFNVSSVVYVHVLTNKTSLLTHLNTRVCTLTGEPYTVDSSVYTSSLGVPVRIETEGLDAITTYLSSDVGNRLSCVGDPKRSALWVQPAFDAVSSALPLPLIFYQHWLLGITATEPLIELQKHLRVGRLPYPCTLQRTTREYVAETMGADRSYNLLLTTDTGFNGTVSQTFYNQSTPFAFEAYTLTCAIRSINEIPVYELYNKQVVVDGRVDLILNDETQGSRVIQTKLLQAPMDSLPSQMMIAHYSACFRSACPLQPVYMDSNSGYVMGVMTGSNGSYLASGLDAEPHIDGSDPSGTGYELFLHDVPQSLFSKSRSMLLQRGKITAPMDWTLDDGPGSSVSSLTNQRVDTHDGFFQYRSPAFHHWQQTVMGDFDPLEHAVVGLQLFRQRFEFSANDTTPLPDGWFRLPHYTSAQCTSNRKSSAEPGLCNYLDEFHMDFNPSTNTVRFYPIQWAMEVILDVVVANDNASVPLALTPASLDGFGRRVNNCPKVDIQHLQNDFTHVHMTYSVLPREPRILEVAATACEQESTTMTGEFHRNYTVGTTQDTGDFRALSTVTVGVPGCSRQLLSVTVMDPDNVAPRNSCIIFEAGTQTLAIEVVRQETVTIVTVQNNQLSDTVGNLGALSSTAPELALEVAERGLIDTFNAILNEEALNSSIEAEIADKIVALELLRTSIEQQVAQQHSLGLAFLTTEIPALRQQFNETRLKTEEVVAYINNLAETENQYRIYQEEAGERDVLFAQAINKSNSLVESLALTQFIFGNAPANFSFANLGYLLTILGNITCPALFEEWTDKVWEEAANRWRCTDFHGIPIGWNCLHGELTFVKYLIYAVAFVTLAVGTTYLANVSQFGLKLCPRTSSNEYRKALWALPQAGVMRNLVIFGIFGGIGTVFSAIF